ncbi:MAG TPA: 4Fe-4S binding protein [Candidatus Deferrimicrobium sp.]|nr:4Fe-4S binding protein [Candidatus Deferrimicrobium sp.]
MDEYDEDSGQKRRSGLILKIGRLLIQFFFFILFGNLVFIFGYNILGGIAKYFNGFPLPIMQSHATPGTTITGVFDVLMESISHGLFFGLILALGSLLLFGIIFGRATCGWVCPFGFVLDLCYYVPVRKRYPGIQINSQLSKVKFAIVILTFFIVIAFGLVVAGGGTPLPLGPFTDNPFSPIDPATTIQAVIPNLIMNPGAYGWPTLEEGFWNIFSWSPWFWFRVIFMVIILILCIYIARAWCRWFCPMGAMLGLLNPYAIVGVQRNVSKCLGKKCRTCELACPMGVPLLREPWEKITHTNCILCMKCYEACPEGAITLSFFQFKQT